MQEIKILFPGNIENQHISIAEGLEKVVYSSPEEVWFSAEKKEAIVWVVSSSFITNNKVSFLQAIRALHEQMVICLVDDLGDIQVLTNIVNACAFIRICSVNDLQDTLNASLADALLLHMEIQKKERLIAALQLENEQYEFMLRQSLLF